MIGEILDALFTGLGSELGSTFGVRHAAKIAREEGKVLAAIRVQLGEFAGLAKRWRVRELSLRKGAFSFKLRKVRVVAIYRRAGPVGLWDAVGAQLPGDLVIFDIQGESAQLGLAVMAEDADRVADMLTPTADEH